MPKVGIYEFPALGIDEAERYLLKLKELHSDEMNKEVAAEAMHLTVDKGRYNRVVASMGHWGLIDASGKKVEITERGKRLMYPDSPQEAEEVKNEAVKGSLIFVGIYGKYGSNPTEEHIRLFLRQTAVVSREEAENKSLKVLKAYKKVVKYFKLAKKPLMPRIGRGIARREIPMPAEPEAGVVFDVKVGDVYMQAPRTPEGIEIARKVVQDALRMLEEQVKKPKKEVKKQE